MKRSIFTAAVVAAGLLGLPGSAWAQAWPQEGKTITLVVPFAPGGASDILSRLIGQKLGEQWKAPVVVQNRPGGDMVIALQGVSRAPKDGYTMGLTTSSFALNKVVKKDFPLDPVADFAFIGTVGHSPYLLAVGADSKVRSFKDLEAATREAGAKPSYASCCFGTYFAAEMIRSVTRLDGVHVPYKGSAPALNAMLGKEVDYIIDTTTATRPFIASAKLRPLMVTSRKRSPAFPDVPSLTEAGVPGDFEAGVWYGFVFPAGTPADVVRKANATLNEVLAMPDVKNRIESLDIEVMPSTPEAMAARVAADLRSYQTTTKTAGLTFAN